MVFVVHEQGHPDADLPVAAQQRREMDPPAPSLGIGFGEPPYACRDASAVDQRLGELLLDLGATADSVHDGAWHEAGDT